MCDTLSRGTGVGPARVASDLMEGVEGGTLTPLPASLRPSTVTRVLVFKLAVTRITGIVGLQSLSIGLAFRGSVGE